MLQIILPPQVGVAKSGAIPPFNLFCGIKGHLLLREHCITVTTEKGKWFLLCCKNKSLYEKRERERERTDVQVISP